MRLLPGSLAKDYEIENPDAGGLSEADSCIVRDQAGRRFFLKFSCPSDLAAAVELREMLTDRARRCPSIQPLHDSGIADSSRFYELTSFEAGGSLEGLLKGGERLSEADFCRLVRDLADALISLQEVDGEGRRIVHGDIKPSNILVGRDGSGARGFRLTDLSGSIVLREGRASFAPHHSPGYASPELLYNAKSADQLRERDWLSIDFWSFGIVALYACTGRFPFAGLNSDQVRDLVLVDWKASSATQVSAAIDRALVNGLLQRRSALRWSDVDVRRWLRVKQRRGEEDDYSFIAARLAATGENTADKPFEFAGMEVLDLRELAEYLLYRWDVTALTSPALSNWLTTHYPISADLLRDLLANPDYPNDVRLLRFAYSHLESPPGESPVARVDPVWRAVVLTESSLRDTARAARNENEQSAEWLESLFQIDREVSAHTGVAYLLQNPMFDIADLLNRIEQSRAAYYEAWQSIIDAGGPIDLRPDNSQLVLEAVSLALDRDYAAELAGQRSELFDVRLLLRRAPWFMTFGTGRDVTPEQLLVLRHTNNSSIFGQTVIERLADMPALSVDEVKDEVLIPQSQIKLLNGLVARPAAEVLELRPGETFSDIQLSGLADWWRQKQDGLLGHVSRGIRWLRGLFGRTDAEIDLMVHAAAMVAHERAHERYTSYLVLANWNVDPACDTSLVVREDRGFNRMTKLRINDLPPEGSMQLLLTSDSRIEVQAKAGRWRPAQRTESIVLRFRRRPELHVLARGLRSCTGRFLPTPSQKSCSLNILSLPKGKLKTTSKSLGSLDGRTPDLKSGPYLRKAPSAIGIDKSYMKIARQIVDAANTRQQI